MEAKLQRWGNSDGIRIPSIFLKSLNLKTNDKVELNFENNKIIISKPKKKITLEERFENYKGENQAKNFTWDEPRGKELW
ncbi:MAG: AbrB/MazE/SpoVT family DNA-binding domain-containing protein [Bacilli bacterium]|nr:AbrB/MazE/SpoVT family DNA-binding domain-containing protein [Bacilli bacterium]